MLKRIFSVPVGFLLIVLFSVLISSFSLYSQSIRLDESQSIWVSTKSVRDILYLQSQDVNPPLYNLLLHFWVQVFGTSLDATRTLSLIFFLLTLGAIYILFKEASNTRIAFLTVALFALSPFVLWYSNETRTYTLFTLVTTINNIYYLQFLRTRGQTGKLGFVLSAVIGTFTHYFFFFVLLTQFLYAIIRHRNLFLKFFGLLFLTGFGFLPWAVYVFINGLAAATQPVIPTPTTFNIFETLISFLFGFQNPVVTGVLVSFWPLIVLFMLLVFTNRPQLNHAREIDYFMLLSFLPIILTFLLSFIRPIFLARYLIFVLPTLFFLLAWALENFPAGLSRLFTTILLVIMVGLLLVQNFSVNTPVKEDYQQVSNFLDQNAAPQDIIAVSAPFTIYPLEYSYTGHTKIVTIPLWDQYAVGPTPPFTVNSMQSQLASYSQIYNRLFLVLSYDQGYESRIRNYMDTHYKLLEDKVFPSGIDLRVYKLRYS
ncbi:glycosyltransferase family 39 protein [Patescibacteria group bacterium]|nr:glycosyltransferase family 39 protein [Patescibacteria group bacterium]